MFILTVCKQLHSIYAYICISYTVKVYRRQFFNIFGSFHLAVSLRHATHGDSALASFCKCNVEMNFLIETAVSQCFYCNPAVVQNVER